MQPVRRDRREEVDALRAFALFGILLVNINGFVWGAKPLGYFGQPPGMADRIAYLAVGTLVSTKFIGLFSFLFGYGFTLQMRALRRGQASLAQARQVYRRRLGFLLALGAVHGVFLYPGDVLTSYALCGFLLLRYAGVRPARLARAVRAWWIGSFAMTGLTAGLIWFGTSVAPVADAASLPIEARQAFAVYTQSTYLAQFPQRLLDYATTVIGTVMVLPTIVALFLTGALAARLGWLTHPQRHRLLWRRAAEVGTAGLVASAIGAGLVCLDLLSTPGGPGWLGFLFRMWGIAALALYLAALVRWRRAAPLQAAVAWLAPAGRMPLTNYLMQSVVMNLLLTGWGLGLGARLGHAQLSVLAVAIVSVQIVLSRLCVTRYGSGPMEVLWRRATYGRAS